MVSPYGSTVRRMDTWVNQLVLFSRVAGEKLNFEKLKEEGTEVFVERNCFQFNIIM